jgi:hypothetical protein
MCVYFISIVAVITALAFGIRSVIESERTWMNLAQSRLREINKLHDKIWEMENRRRDSRGRFKSMRAR